MTVTSNAAALNPVHLPPLFSATGDVDTIDLNRTARRALDHALLRPTTGVACSGNGRLEVGGFDRA